MCPGRHGKSTEKKQPNLLYPFNNGFLLRPLFRPLFRIYLFLNKLYVTTMITPQGCPGPGPSALQPWWQLLGLPLPGFCLGGLGDVFFFFLRGLTKRYIKIHTTVIGLTVIICYCSDVWVSSVFF